ncbi:hypothetical protein KSP35_19675 [Aquihabitans sp. G128]|uniref:hypothetical protein n=1 Tax=Aquihabitans sp. G128 TaxID=2849779 RepID=UPI001C24582F|nr:hypothetical protein [Aquihabitans sp. G128]QXC60519.1 hypothetical protein KSP35_19675 [Aquihabitans sp. G128]
MNEGERRELLIQRLLDGQPSDRDTLNAEDEVLLTNLAAASVDFLAEVQEVLIPPERPELH